MSAQWPKNEHMEMVWQKALDVLKPSRKQLDHGLELHKESIVCDNFGFLPKVWTDDIVQRINRMVDDAVGPRVFGLEQTMLRIHGPTRDQAGSEEFVSALKNAGVSCLVQTVGGGNSVAGVLKNMAAHRHLCHSYRKHLFQATAPEDIREAKEQGRTCIVWSVNGPPPLGDPGALDEKLGWVESWYHFGVRLMHLSYNRRNEVADGCTEPADAGLSEYGKEFVRKLNEVGIIVDTPHSGKQTTLDAARFSEKPVTASHVGCEGVFPGHPRCKSDEELKAIAGTGGMVGIYCVPSLLGPDASIATMLDHLDYAAKLIGADHVAIGTDVPYMRPWPKELKSYPARKEATLRGGGWKKEHMKYSTTEHIHGSLAWTNWPLFTVGLVMRGYPDDDIRKILGQNLMRVLDANRPPGEVRL